MITTRRYEDVMDKSKKSELGDRLGDRSDEKSKAELKEFAIQEHRNIVNCLSDMNYQLQLVLKTNDYLRAIDRRLGNPDNTF